MKGLIIKDLYMTVKDCKRNIILAIILAVLSFTTQDLLFFAFYSPMITGLIPYSLLAYDERSRWIHYSETIPYTRAQIVNSKYIITLIIQGAMFILISCAQAAITLSGGTFDIAEFGTFEMSLLTMSLIPAAFTLPFMFKSGAEKGRLSLIFVAVLISMGGTVLAKAFNNDIPSNVDLLSSVPTTCVLCVAIFALSWFLSIAFYRKREL